MKRLKELTLIEGTNTLKRTTFIEFLPGPYSGKCWGESSAYVDAEHPQYNLLENLFRSALPNFDPFDFITYPKDDWVKVIALMDQMENESLPDNFKCQFGKWITNTLYNFDEISFLGL